MIGGNSFGSEKHMLQDNDNDLFSKKSCQGITDDYDDGDFDHDDIFSVRDGEPALIYDSIGIESPNVPQIPVNPQQKFALPLLDPHEVIVSCLFLSFPVNN